MKLIVLMLVLLISLSAQADYENHVNSVVIIKAFSPGENGIKTSSGAGFYISSHTIVTSLHIVDGYKNIIIASYDGRQAMGRLVKADRIADIALIETAMFGKALLLDPEAKYSRGDTVVVIGHPNSLYYSFTSGIVSHVSRRINNINNATYIQIDAAVNTGNSGSPVFANGKVIGMVQSIVSASGGFEGISMVYPVNEIIRTFDKFKSTHNRYMKYNYTGIITTDTTRDIADNSQVIISEIEPDSPAAIAKLQAGDIILALDSKLTPTKTAYRTALDSVVPETEVVILVRRGGKKMPHIIRIREIL